MSWWNVILLVEVVVVVAALTRRSLWLANLITADFPTLDAPETTMTNGF